jgi:hypothetical protein
VLVELRALRHGRVQQQDQRAQYDDRGEYCPGGLLDILLRIRPVLTGINQEPGCARNCTTAATGSPTTLEYDPSIRVTNLEANP